MEEIEERIERDAGQIFRYFLKIFYIILNPVGSHWVLKIGKNTKFLFQKPLTY